MMIKSSIIEKRLEPSSYIQKRAVVEYFYVNIYLGSVTRFHALGIYISVPFGEINPIICTPKSSDEFL
jgi:hypothetical protein